MKNTLYEYVIWRGDISHLQTPYNEVDYLIFSELAYVNFDNVISPKNEPLSLNEAFELYQKRNQTLNDQDLSAIYNESHHLFELMIHTKRYQNIKIMHYVNEVDKKLVKQFSAMTFILDDETLFVAYRGTDDSLIGWHEDFLMLCQNTVPSQISAQEYLETVARFPYQKSLLHSLQNHHLGPLTQRIKKHFQLKKGRPIIIGGHSKGGNLAIYAGCFCQSSLQENIQCIYNYDGPGFQDELIQSPQYQNMLPRIHSYLPHYSFFGIVLGHEEQYSVVHSQYTGMLQHNPFSWEVNPFGFIQDELSFESVQFSIKVILFLNKLTYEDKIAFVEAMFGLFESLHLYTFTDLSHISYKHILAAIKELTLLPPHVRKMLIEVLHMLWLEAKKTKK